LDRPILTALEQPQLPLPLMSALPPLPNWKARPPYFHKTPLQIINGLSRCLR
jgi:hypothetical protein